MLIPPLTEMQIAIHEAGHVVTALAHYHTSSIFLGLITIEPGHDYAGCMEYWFKYDDEPELNNKIRALISISGIEAVKIKYGEGEVGNGMEAWSDLCRYDELLSELSDDDQERYDELNERFGAEVEATLRQYWQLVENIANILMEKRTLNFVDALMLFNEARKK